MSSYIYYTTYNGEVLPSDFQELLWQKSRELYRDMPWRQDTRPYYVLVSEIMLQQTQVSRVIEKFNLFIARFPDITYLANAPLAEVLSLWSGLGYNRRARYLHQAAQEIVSRFGGVVPGNYGDLVSLPGVGQNTAGAILAYSFNQPVVFVETNIRTVYFHHFFDDEVQVDDTAIKQLVTKTIDHEHPREFYWALMDYGSELKRTAGGRLDKSKHYKKQSLLKGSVREIRGLIVKQVTLGQTSLSRLKQTVPHDERFDKAISGLVRDGIITVEDDSIHFTSS